MNTDSTIVIVGAGLAGTEAAFALRDGGHEGRIVMIGREAWPPYDRPPLSKSFLKGELPRERLWLRPAKSYTDEQIELQLGAEVVSIDRTQRRVRLATGATLDYGSLLLATGGEARRLTIPGADLDGVCELKSLDDADRLRAGLVEGRSVVIIGGGYVGMEFAATACQAACKVTVLESQDRVLSRSLSATVAQYLQGEYENRGVRILTGASVTRIEGEGRVDAVLLKDGTRLPADVVLVSVGNQASDALARNDGLQVDRGIVVDREGRTNDPHVFAAGDCTVSCFEGFDEPLRLESVQHATSQAKRAAAAMLGQPAGPDEVPWFWSDQFDIKLQMAGLPLPGDAELLRGDPQSGRFSVIYQNAKRITAIQCVNASGDFSAARRMIADRRRFPPALLSNSLVSMRDIRVNSDAIDSVA